VRQLTVVARLSHSTVQQMSPRRAGARGAQQKRSSTRRAVRRRSTRHCNTCCSAMNAAAAFQWPCVSAVVAYASPLTGAVNTCQCWSWFSAASGPHRGSTDSGTPCISLRGSRCQGRQCWRHLQKQTSAACCSPARRRASSVSTLCQSASALLDSSAACASTLPHLSADAGHSC